MTHYYCILYAVFLSLCCGLYLLFHRRHKEFLLLCLAQIVSALFSVLLFPFMLSHIFCGYRGVQSFENMADLTFSQNLAAIVRSFLGIDRKLLGGILAGMLFFSVLFLIRAAGNGRKPLLRSLPSHAAPFLCCFASCLLYFLTVTRIAVSDDLKYFAPMYGVLFCAAVGLVGRWCRHIPGYQYPIFALILLLAMGNSWRNEDWPHLYRSSQELLDATEACHDTDCICVYSDPLEVYTLYEQIFRFRSATFYTAEDLDGLLQTPLFERNELIVLTEVTQDDAADTDLLLRIMSLCPQLKTYSRLGDAGYFHIYRFTG